MGAAVILQYDWIVVFTTARLKMLAISFASKLFFLVFLVREAIPKGVGVDKLSTGPIN